MVTEGIAIGQTIAALEGKNYPPGAWDGRPQHRICVAVDSERFLKFYRETIVRKS